MIILDASGVFLDQVSHNYNAFYLQFGISMNIPELRRSPIKADHVQLKHVITDPKYGRLEEVRGQPLWKKQNPKVGQNHRRFISCLLYTSPSPRDATLYRMPSSA